MQLTPRVVIIILDQFVAEEVGSSFPFFLFQSLRGLASSGFSLAGCGWVVVCPVALMPVSMKSRSFN